MTAIEKFKFELNFDDADTVIRPAGAEEEHYSIKRKSQRKKREEEEKGPPPPPAIYTEEQMQTMLREAESRARDEAFTQGHAQGLTQGRDEILASVQKTVSDTAGQIAARLEHIDEIQKRAHATTAEDAIHVTRAIVKKLIPAWTQGNTTLEIENIVRQCLSNLFDVPKVLVQVHPDIAEELQNRVSEIARSRGFSGQAVVVGEASIATGDCRVSWGDGTAIRDQERTWAEINAVVDNAITAHREGFDLSHDNPMTDPEIQESRKPEPAAAPGVPLQPQANAAPTPSPPPAGAENTKTGPENASAQVAATDDE
jgi:flagellar assembly protein FliH